MAGLDFEFSSERDEEALQLQLLRRMEAAGEPLNLRLECAERRAKLWRRPTMFYVSLHGPLPAMQALPFSCYSDLGAIADVMAKPSAHARRMQVLARLLEAFEDGLEEITEHFSNVGKALEALEDEGWAVASRSIDFDPGSKTHLGPSLRDFRLALIQALIGRITHRSLLEECHTVTEHLMDALLAPRDRRSLSYSSKIDELVKQGIFDVYGENKRVFGNLPEQLKELKECRRDAKHRGQSIDRETVDRVVGAATGSAQVLLAALRKRDRERESAGAPHGGSRPS